MYVNNLWTLFPTFETDPLVSDATLDMSSPFGLSGWPVYTVRLSIADSLKATATVTATGTELIGPSDTVVEGNQG